MTKEDTKQGLKCCTDYYYYYYYCACLYKIYDPYSQYPIRCMHKMILDVWKYYFDEVDK